MTTKPTRSGPTHCAECGVPITQNACGQIRKYCCDTHRNRFNRRKCAKPTRAEPCHECGGEISPKRRKGGTPKLYCSVSCGRRTRQKRISARRQLRTSCEHCGEPMTSMTVLKRFCCSVCKDRALRARKKLPPPPSPAELYVMRVGWPGAERRAPWEDAA